MALTDTARLVASLELVDKFSKPIANIERSMGRLESRSSLLSRGLGTALGIGIARATSATVGLGKSVLTTAISFEEAFAGVRKTVEATDGQLAALHESFRDAAKETGIAFEELSRIGAIGGALNVATDSLDEFALSVAKASTATGLSVDELADSLGRVGNILSLDASTYETFLSTLVELGNKGASTEGEILEITKRFAATGKQAGLTTPQILGLSSAIAGLGVEPEAAGGALSRIMSNFITETAEGSDKAKEFAKVAGDSFKDFAKTVEDDTLGAVLKFAAGLNELDKGERFQALKEAGITNIRDRNAILLFAGAIDEVNRQLGLANDEFGKTNALSEEFRKRQETTAVQLGILKQNLRDVANTIGSAVLPKIVELSKEFVDFINQKDTQKAIKDFAESLPAVVDDLVGIAKGIPWEAIGASAKLMGTGARALLSAFQGLPDWVQTAVLTGWGLNKLTGGLLGNIASTLGKAAFGGLRGGTPATPVFTKEVGLGGVGGAPGVGGAGGGLTRTLLGAAGKIIGVAVAAEVGNVIGHELFFDPTVQPTQQSEQRQFDEFSQKNARNQAELARGLRAVDDGLADLYGVNAEGRGILMLIAGDQVRQLEAQREQLRLMVRATPTGQFVPENPGGTPGTPQGSAVPKAFFDNLGIQIRANEKGVRQALKEGDIHQARLLERNIEAMHDMRGTVRSGFTDVIPKLGAVNRALSTANRNLENGNARQRETAQRVAEARDRIGNGFARSNEQLGVIAGKDFSPHLNVAVTANTSVSISEVTRAAVSNSFASGFTPGLLNG